MHVPNQNLLLKFLSDFHDFLTKMLDILCSFRKGAWCFDKEHGTRRKGMARRHAKTG